MISKDYFRLNNLLTFKRNVVSEWPFITRSVTRKLCGNGQLL